MTVQSKVSCHLRVLTQMLFRMSCLDNLSQGRLRLCVRNIAFVWTVLVGTKRQRVAMLHNVLQPRAVPACEAFICRAKIVKLRKRNAEI